VRYGPLQDLHVEEGGRRRKGEEGRGGLGSFNALEDHAHFSVVVLDARVSLQNSADQAIRGRKEREGR